MIVDFYFERLDGPELLYSVGLGADGKPAPVGGDMESAENILDEPIRDPRNPRRFLWRGDGEEFLRLLPGAYQGTRFYAQAREAT